MKFLFTYILIGTIQFLHAQKINYSVMPGIQKRNECDITSVIPFGEGLLSVAMDSKGNSIYDYSIKLCKIKKDHSVEKGIDIGFQTEDNMRLIGIYQINQKPVIFYTLYSRKKKALQIKAAVLNPISLQLTGIKVVKYLELKTNDEYLLNVMDRSDVEWVSPVKIKMSQDSSRYLLIYDMFCCGPDAQDKEMAYYAVINEQADIVFDKLDVLGTWNKIKLKDYCLSKDGKIFSIYQKSVDQPIFSSYYSAYTTYLRIIDITTSKIVDIPLDKSLEFIKHPVLFFKNSNINALEILGSYSTTFDGDISGGFWISWNSVSDKITEIKKEPFPKELILERVYKEYYEEVYKNKGGFYLDPLYERLEPVYTGMRENGSIDLTLEYNAIHRGPIGIVLGPKNGYNSFSLSCINFNFSGDKIAFTVLHKQQLTRVQDGLNAMGVFQFSYRDKLLFFYNDLKENNSKLQVNQFFNPSAGLKGVLIVAEIDKNGNLQKKVIDVNSRYDGFAEPIHFKLIDNRSIVFRLTTSKNRQKEFYLGFIEIE